VAERVEFCQGDLLAPLPAAQEFDFIISNPPYVTEAEYAELARDVRDYEPRQALVAGPTGVEVIERLVAQAGRRLTPSGWLLIEISPMIEAAVHQIITGSGHFRRSETIRDLAGHARVVKAVTPS
jgi:release factor glutamine methyltransferase